jgi:hypothetical protein
MRTGALENLKRVNQRLRDRLSQFDMESPPSVGLSAGQVAEMFAVLLQAADVLQSAPECGSIDREMSEQISEYRSHINRLQHWLPTIQTVLLAERAGLEAERKHLLAAAGWAQASKDSL